MLNSWKISIISTTLLLVVSCGSLHIEKRVHRKGYYVHWNKPIKSTHDQSSESVSNLAEPDSSQIIELQIVETPVAGAAETFPVSEQVSIVEDLKSDLPTTQNDQQDPEQVNKPSDHREISADPELNRSKKYREPGKGYTIAGVVLIILGLAIVAASLALGGWFFSLFGLAFIAPGFISFKLGQRRDTGKVAPDNREGKVNLFALFALILLPFAIIGNLNIFLFPVVLGLFIVANIQFKRHPEKYRAKWMVNVIWLMMIAAALFLGLSAIYMSFIW